MRPLWRDNGPPWEVRKDEPASKIVSGCREENARANLANEIFVMNPARTAAARAQTLSRDVLAHDLETRQLLIGQSKIRLKLRGLLVIQISGFDVSQRLIHDGAI